MAVAHAANEPPKVALICEPPIGKTVDGKVPPPIYFNRFTRDGPLMRLEGRTDKNNRVIGVKRVAVSSGEVKQLCDSGFPVSVFDVAEFVKSAAAANGGDHAKGYVPPLTALPTEFTIYRTFSLSFLSWQTFGSFWVPQAMPSGHTYQVVDFTVTPSNYENSGPYSHFAVSSQTVSDSNFASDFDVKGAIFYGSAGACGTVLQSWAIQNYSDYTDPPCGTYTGCSNPVFAGSAPAPWTEEPSSCGAWDAATPKRFLVGSNIWQNSVYWRCDPGGTCPSLCRTP